MRPTAIGMDVVPTLSELMKSPTPVFHPSRTPKPIARKIQSVRNLSRKERRPVADLFMHLFYEIGEGMGKWGKRGGRQGDDDGG
jgi:hypothetical protein